MLKGDMHGSRAICEFSNIGSLLADAQARISVKGGKAVIL